MKAQNQPLTGFLIVALICAALAGMPAYGQNGQSQGTLNQTITLMNNSASADATVQLTFAGTINISTSKTGTGGSTIAFFNGSLAQGTNRLFTDPASGNFSQTFNFTIAAGTSLVLTSSGQGVTSATGTEPGGGSASAGASESLTDSFLTSSADVSLTIAATFASSYGLFVQPIDPSLETYLCSFSLTAGSDAPVTASETTGATVEPLTSSASVTLTADQAYDYGISMSDQAQVTVAPEPSTIALGLLGGLGMIWTLRRRAA